MLVKFEELPETSKVWIYQANRSFTEQEQESINSKIEVFINNWTSHGSDLQAAYLLKYKRFIVLALNSELNKATGCSIDASVGWITSL